MFPLKRFVQGPSLHDETVSYAETPDPQRSNTGTLNGEEASKAYEEIINLPSTADEVQIIEPTPTPSASVKRKSKSERDNFSTSTEETVPKLSRLFMYCESNDYKSLKRSLQRFKSEIDIDSVDEYGWTMLMSASCAGSLECVSVLLQHGANWNIKDKKGQTALYFATKKGQDTICQLIQDWHECYIEQQDRQNERRQQIEDDLGEQSKSQEASSSKTYCDTCQIYYESVKDTHERSIAHLVCTAQFGKDKIHFGIPESNKGFQLMVKSGWDQSSGLGPEGRGHKFPVKTVLKRNKLGLGNEKERKAARITHFGPFDPAAVETQPERLEREATVQRKETIKQRCKERRKEINFRREFSSL